MSLSWRQEAADAGCSLTLGLVVEPSAERSTEICADVAESPFSRDSHVVVTNSSPVELYIDNSRHDFLLVFTGIFIVLLWSWNSSDIVSVGMLSG